MMRFSAVVLVLTCLLYTACTAERSEIELETRYRRKGCSEADSAECNDWADMGFCDTAAYSNACPHACSQCGRFDDDTETCEFPSMLTTTLESGSWRYSGYRALNTETYAVYHCFNGWKYSQPDNFGMATCDAESGVLLPTCVKSDCFFNYNILSKHQRRWMYYSNDTALYRCDTDYFIEGTDKVEGLAVCVEGTVQHPDCVRPEEERDCDLPRKIAGGYRVKAYQNNTALYFCTTGYIYDSLSGGGIGKCELGQPILPVCVASSCTYPPVIPYGRKSAYNSDDTAVYKCDKGYEFTDDRDGFVRCYDGVLDIPLCVEVQDRQDDAP